ncbi:MAG: M13 family metallopeptidase [Prevotella sp.]|nr:M13 family metallopeptidase [Prevotella sp.]
MMKKLTARFWMLIALPMLLGLVSCTDIVVNPVINPDEPTVKDDGVWTLDENIDQSIIAGDDFFMHAVGLWWATAEIDEDEGITGFLMDIAAKAEEISDNIDMGDADKIEVHAKDLTSNAEADKATIASATDRIEQATTREDLWRLMGQLKRDGFQMPFHLISLAQGGRMGVVFTPLPAPEVAGLMTGTYADDDDSDWGDDDDFDWSLARTHRNAKKWERLLRNPGVKRLMEPIGRAAATRGFSSEQWPMFVAVCEGLGVSPDDAYVISGDFAEAAQELMLVSSTEQFEELQAMDIEELQEELLSWVSDDRLFFDEAARQTVAEALEQDIPDAEIILEGLMPRYMLYYVSHAYCQQFVTPDMRQHGQEAAEQLRRAFSLRIEDNAWLSPASKQSAQEKIAAMTFNVAYPDWISEGLADFSQTRSLFEDILEMRRAYTALMLNIAGQTVAQGSFHALVAAFVPLTEVNAFYVPFFNSINILPAFLTEPLYASEAADAYNYATYMVFGHEMTHGFDTIGSEYDKNGDHNPIWASPADEQEFNRRAQLLSDYYSRFEIVPGHYADGEETLGENIADLGGTEIALQALTTRLQGRGISGDELRLQQQRFFYAYAHLWQAKYDDVYALMTSQMDEHSLPRERVNGVVSNIDLWYDLFNIREGQTLYQAPAKRIHIW